MKHVGVIPEPEVLQHELSIHDKFIILASDGVWEFITSQVLSLLHSFTIALVRYTNTVIGTVVGICCCIV